MTAAEGAREGLTDVEIADACPVCGGTLMVRVRLPSAGSYCAHCRRVSSSKVLSTPRGVFLTHTMARS